MDIKTLLEFLDGDGLVITDWDLIEDALLEVNFAFNSIVTHPEDDSEE